MPSSPRIVISIVSWNYLENVRRMVSALKQNSGITTDLLVLVETGTKPDDAFRHWAHEAQIRLVEHPENEGYAAAHLLSAKIMQQEGYDGILVLNPDLKLSPGLIERLKQEIIHTENRSVLGAPVYTDRNGKPDVEYLGYPVPDECRPMLEQAVLADANAIKITPEIRYLADDLHGCLVYFPASVVAAHGWMHTHYFLYGEENEYLHRLRQKGVSLFVSSQLAVLHENGGTFKQTGGPMLLLREYYRTRNRLYNNRIFQGHSSWLRFNFWFVLKYALGRYLLRLRRFRQNDLLYYNFLGHLHFIKGRRGKTFDPSTFTHL